MDTETTEDVVDFDPVESMSIDNVRLITFANGMNIIAIVVEQEDGSVATMLPMEVMTEFDEETMALKAYHLLPYLDNLHQFDIEAPAPVIFNEGMVVSLTLPIPHLFRTYYLHLKIMQEVYDEDNEITRLEPDTIH